MNLKQIRQDAECTQPDIVEYLKCVEPRMSVPMLSVIEAGAVLTNKETLKALCHFFGVNPSDIYSESEMNLSNCLGREVASQPKKPDRHRNTCRPGHRLSETAYKSLKTAVFNLGYRNLQDWYNEMVKETVMAFERQTRAESEKGITA